MIFTCFSRYRAVFGTLPCACFIFCCLILSGCSDTPKQEQPARQEGKATVEAPAFDADSAYVLVEKQLAFGPRVPNTEAHRQCGDFLISTLRAHGARVQTQDFEAKAYDGKTLRLRNIIASYRPEASKRIMLAAHWDTRPIADKDTENSTKPIDGANDGASGVAVLLEIARQLHLDSLSPVGVDIVLFDGEDYGEPHGQEMTRNEASNTVWWCLGSQYWAKNKHTKNYLAYYGILLDMVGAANATFYQEELSVRNARTVVKKVWDYAHQLGYGQYFVYKESPEVLDDHVFVNYEAGIPMINIIAHDSGREDSFFPAYHHTHADNIDIIDKATLKAVGQTVLHALYQE